MTLYVPAFLPAESAPIKRPWQLPAENDAEAVDCALAQARTAGWRLVQLTRADDGASVWRCPA